MMKKSLLPLAVVTALASIGASAGEIRHLRESNVVRNQYIVVFKEARSLKAANLTAEVAGLASQLSKRHGVTTKFHTQHVLRSAVVNGTEDRIRKLAEDPEVAYVEADRYVKIVGTQNNATWGLDRIDQADLPLNTSYNYATDGSGVHAYIIDTGIYASHSDFSGRLGNGYDAVNDGNGTNDCQGHGTHVAGTVGGTTWGVAKNVTLHAVRVLNCQGSGTNSGVIAGMDWVRSNAMRPAVANMSLGGGASQAVDDAIANLSNAGVTVAVAAGNESSNACNVSPARAPSAITVGSTTSSDGFSSFSNFGSCVDILAPGSSITSAGTSSPTSSRSLSGTSMATPHVAGAAALYLGTHTSASPAEVSSALVAAAVSGKISSVPSGTVNKLLNVGDGGTTPPPPTGDTALSNGQALANQSYSQGQSKFYTLDVPAGQSSLVFNTSGGSGDADIYVQVGQKPSHSTFACKGEGSTTAETCTINNPQAGKWYLEVYGYSAASGVSVKGSYTGGGGTGATALTNNVALGGINLATGEKKYYSLQVPAGTSKVTFSSTGGSGDADLYVQQGSLPSTTSNVCRSEGSTNTESCVINSPAAGTWYVMMYGYATVSGTSVKGAY